MENVKKKYKDAFKAHGDSPSSVLCPKGRQSDRFSVLCEGISANAKNFSVLDYGCGLSHLKDFLDARFSNYSYTGVDFVEDFIEHGKKKNPQAHYLHIDEFEKQSDLSFDYIIVSGTFNILYHESRRAHQEKVFQILKMLFEKAKIYLAVDFMTSKVDFEQPTAYHANPCEILDFSLSSLSRRSQLNHSYLPYEFCLTAWKNDQIRRPENVYV